MVDFKCERVAGTALLPLQAEALRELGGSRAAAAHFLKRPVAAHLCWLDDAGSVQWMPLDEAGLMTPPAPSEAEARESVPYGQR